MDFKMLAQFVMLAGLGVFAYGGYQYQSAETKAEQRIKQTGRQLGFFGGVVAGLDAQAMLQSEQQEAKKLMGIGGGILFLGFALSVSSKEKPSPAAGGVRSGLNKYQGPE